ncbi:DNA transformation protein [Bradyrhizobium sp. i1.7.7]
MTLGISTKLSWLVVFAKLLPVVMGPRVRGDDRGETAWPWTAKFLIDLFADFGPVTIRKMFSGYGISADGINFALALRAGLFFRADEVTIPDFEAEGSKPFQYSTRAKTVLVNSYWELPARLFDDSEELAQWARAALAAAQRAKVKKRPKGKKAVAKKTPAKKTVKKRAAKKAVRRVGKATRPP